MRTSATIRPSGALAKPTNPQVRRSSRRRRPSADLGDSNMADEGEKDFARSLYGADVARLNSGADLNTPDPMNGGVLARMYPNEWAADQARADGPSNSSTSASNERPSPFTI